MADAPAALDQAERAVTRAVTVALDATAVEFARAVSSATSLTAASFSVGRIASMWGRRIPALVRRFLGVVETAADTTADSVDDVPPDGWDDLPARYDDGRELPPGIGSYVTVTEHLLRAVGDRLAEVAREELSEGLQAGETTAQLKARLRRAFNREGAQLGPTRAALIAETETTRAWNTGTLAVAQALTGPERPLVKQWLTRRDTKVRSAHANVNGQLRLLDEPFTVAGTPMDAPGDPTAPPELVCNCRCYLAVAVASRTATASPPALPPESQEPFGAASKNPRKGPFVMPETETVTAAADGSHLQGAMIALMPTAEDARRLAIEGGEAVEQLHLTLAFLGDDGDVWTPEQRRRLTDDVRNMAAEDLPGPITGRAFGAAHWNAGGDSPSWVWSVGDDRDRPDGAPSLADAHALAAYALDVAEDIPDVPAQHSPWAAHICAAYSDEAGLLPELEQRLGPVTFDRIRVTFAGDATDIPLGPQPTAPLPRTAAGLEARGWHTPDDAALAYENEETGDGRIFVPGALYWDGNGPWPLQYADEMLSGHEGAELAGSIQTMDRDGGRLAGTGVLYPGRPAGADAVLLLEEGAPLGVSVDLDAVSIEFVDRTMPDGQDPDAEPVEVIYASATVDQLSVMRMDDGAWMLRTSGKGEWTASAGGALTLTGHSALVITSADARVSCGQLLAAFPTATLTAAAGDADDPERGTVVHSESAGDLLVRITRGRVRGATLVAMPAYDRARIVLDPYTPPEPSDQETAAAIFNTLRANGVSLDPLTRVISYVATAPLPVGAREVACRLQISMAEAHKHLARATQDGRLVRLARGMYAPASTHPEGVTAVTADGGEAEPMTELMASAWSAIREADPMPADWFREPTAEELPPGSGGVHYANGRIFGWVAQAGVPHAGHPGRNLTIESLGDVDLTHFLRARFKLDDGTMVRAGAFTMDVGHHRDGAECETEACQFDNSRTVAGVVTVGMNDGGLWFSGAAAPHLSGWSQTVFRACQPSYHMRQGRSGRWELRAVLSVPVPGHSSPLVAAVVEQANLALTASAAPTLDAVPAAGSDTAAGHQDTLLTDEHFDALTAALLDSPTFIARFCDLVETRAVERARTRQEIAALVEVIRPGAEPPAYTDDGRDLADGLVEVLPPLREMAAALAGHAHTGRN